MNPHSTLHPSQQPMRAKVFAFGLMCLGFFMATLDIQIVASSLRDIGGGLSASQDELSWIQTSYLIAEILVIPMSGWLSRVFSTRWLFTASAIGFTITSMMCGMAWDMNSMILFRALQGALGAAMIPTVSRQTTRDCLGQYRCAGIACADHRTGHRRLDYLAVVLALAVFPEFGAGLGGIHSGAEVCACR